MINIALDGPAGSGKSTIAKAISKKLNILYSIKIKVKGRDSSR